MRYGAGKIMTFIVDKAMNWVSNAATLTNDTNHIQSRGFKNVLKLQNNVQKHTNN